MKLFYRLKLFLILNFFLMLSSSIFAKTIFIDSSAPPPGFESVHFKQYSRASVFFMNQYIGNFYVELHQGQLKFSSPEKLLSQMNGVKKNKDILNLLNQSFPLNIHCDANGIAAPPPDCMELNKAPVYIIYHPQQNIIYLYLSTPYFKKPRDDHGIVFISNSTSGWSYINKLGAAGSFSSENPHIASRVYSVTPNYYNIYSNNTIARGNSSLISNISQNNGINNGAHFQIQNLYAQHIAQDKIYTAGYMVNTVSPFFQTQTIIGAGVKTTLETVKNIENILAAPLVVFIPQASQVSIFKNDQLIYSQYLDAGYQRINTTNFPEGGYELTIKIGATTIAHRFFTKGASLPPLEAPQFYILGGYLTNGMFITDGSYHFLPHVLNVPVVQGGMNIRLDQQIALSSDILMDSHQGLIDFGPAFLLSGIFLKAAGLITTKNNYGIYTTLNMQKNRININLIVTKIHYQKKKTDYVFLNNLIDNDSLSVSYQLSQSSLLGIQSSYTKTIGQRATYSTGTFYQREIGNYKGMSFYINAGYNKAIYVGDSYSFSVMMNFSKDTLAGTESLLWQNQVKNKRDNQLAVPVVVQGSTVYSHQNEQSIGYSLNEIHTLSPTVYSLAGIYNYTAPHSFVATYANYNKIKGNRQALGYGGNLETELAINRHGMALNGINRGNASGMIVYVHSTNAHDNSSKFALLDENNRQILVLTANKKAFVSLPKFTHQHFTLVNLSKSDYFIHEPIRHVILYPGNIGYYSWIVERRLIVFGRAVSKNRMRPLANTWIHAGENGIFSDNEGNFQLELPENTTILEAENNCRIKLNPLNADQNYLNIGDVICT